MGNELKLYVGAVILRAAVVIHAGPVVGELHRLSHADRFHSLPVVAVIAAAIVALEFRTGGLSVFIIDVPQSAGSSSKGRADTLSRKRGRPPEKRAPTVRCGLPQRHPATVRCQNSFPCARLHSFVLFRRPEGGP